MYAHTVNTTIDVTNDWENVFKTDSIITKAWKPISVYRIKFGITERSETIKNATIGMNHALQRSFAGFLDSE